MGEDCQPEAFADRGFQVVDAAIRLEVRMTEGSRLVNASFSSFHSAAIGMACRFIFSFHPSTPSDYIGTLGQSSICMIKR